MTAHTEYGRVDWRPRLKVWRVTVYDGRTDRTLSDHPTYVGATDALRAYVAWHGHPAGRRVSSR